MRLKSLGISLFPKHVHLQGEKIYVIEGVFSDENGDYPGGGYIRNPPGSSHTPFTKQGCTLFIKLEQFQNGDNEHVVIRPDKIKYSNPILTMVERE